MVWLSEEGREKNHRFRDLLPSAADYSRHAVVRHTFGRVPNRSCLEEVNNSRPKGCFEHMIDCQYFSLGYQAQDAFFPQKLISRSSRALTLLVTCFVDETKKLNMREIG